MRRATQSAASDLKLSQSGADELDMPRKKTRSAITVGVSSAFVAGALIASGTVGGAALHLQSQSRENLATTATVLASSESPGTLQVASKVADGSSAGYPGDYTREWASALGRVGTWVELRWATPQAIDQIVLFDRPNLADQITAGTLTFSDGSTQLVATLNNDGSPLTVAVPPKTVTSVRFTATAVRPGTLSAGLSEFQVFGAGSVTTPSTPTTAVTPPTSAAPATSIPTPPTIAPTTPSTAAPTVAPTTVAPTTVAPATVAPTLAPTTTVAAPASVRNIAPNATITASSETASTTQTARKAVDGAATGYPFDPTKEWATVGGRAGSWIDAKWLTPTVINRVVLFDRPNSSDNVRSGFITFSDGSRVEVGAINNDGLPLDIAFPARSATGLRFTITSTSTTTANIGLSELQIWSTNSPAVPTTLAPPTIAPTTTLPATTTAAPTTTIARTTTIASTVATTIPTPTTPTIPPAPTSVTPLNANPSAAGTAGWGVSGAVYDGAVSRTPGSGSFRFPGMYGQLTSSPVKVTPGQPYTLTAYIRTSTWPTGNISLLPIEVNAAGAFVKVLGEFGTNGAPSAVGVWQEYGTVVVPTGTTNYIALVANRAEEQFAGAGDMWLDDLAVLAGRDHPVTGLAEDPVQRNPNPSRRPRQLGSAAETAPGSRGSPCALLRTAAGRHSLAWPPAASTVTSGTGRSRSTWKRPRRPVCARSSTCRSTTSPWAGRTVDGLI